MVCELQKAQTVRTDTCLKNAQEAEGTVRSVHRGFSLTLKYSERNMSFSNLTDEKLEKQNVYTMLFTLKFIKTKLSVSIF